MLKSKKKRFSPNSLVIFLAVLLVFVQNKNAKQKKIIVLFVFQFLSIRFLVRTSQSLSSRPRLRTTAVNQPIWWSTPDLHDVVILLMGSKIEVSNNCSGHDFGKETFPEKYWEAFRKKSVCSIWLYLKNKQGWPNSFTPLRDR